MGQMKNMGGISSITEHDAGTVGSQMKNVSIDDDEAEKNMRQNRSYHTIP